DHFRSRLRLQPRDNRKSITLCAPCPVLSRYRSLEPDVAQDRDALEGGNHPRRYGSVAREPNNAIGRDLKRDDVCRVAERLGQGGEERQVTRSPVLGGSDSCKRRSSKT